MDPFEVKITGSLRARIDSPRKLQDETRQERRILETAIVGIDVHIQKAQKEQGRYLKAYGVSGISLEEYMEKKVECDRTIERLKETRMEYEKQLSAYPVLTEEQELDLMEFREKAKFGLNNCKTFEDKRRMLEILRIECVYDSQTKKLTLSGVLGKYTVGIKAQPELRSKHG